MPSLVCKLRCVFLVTFPASSVVGPRHDSDKEELFPVPRHPLRFARLGENDMARARNVKASAAVRATRVVSEEVFRRVYDSPYSLPGKEKWVTAEQDVRAIEKLLGIPLKTIGAPLWVSGDTKRCPKCDRETNWLDIVSSALTRVHSKDLLVKVILGDKKFVNVENPRAIADLVCFKCKAPILDLRSFKCHNWAYAMPALHDLLEQMSRKASS